MHAERRVAEGLLATAPMPNSNPIKTSTTFSHPPPPSSQPFSPQPSSASSAIHANVNHENGTVDDYNLYDVELVCAEGVVVRARIQDVLKCGTLKDLLEDTVDGDVAAIGWKGVPIPNLTAESVQQVLEYASLLRPKSTPSAAPTAAPSAPAPPSLFQDANDSLFQAPHRLVSTTYLGNFFRGLRCKIEDVLLTSATVDDANNAPCTCRPCSTARTLEEDDANNTAADCEREHDTKASQCWRKHDAAQSMQTIKDANGKEEEEGGRSQWAKKAEQTEIEAAVATVPARAISELFHAANYLDLPSLVELLTRTVGDAVCAETVRLGIHWKPLRPSGALFDMVSPLDVCCKTPLGLVLVDLQECEPALVEMVAEHYSQVILGAIAEGQAALPQLRRNQSQVPDLADTPFKCDYLQPYFIEAVHLTTSRPPHPPSSPPSSPSPSPSSSKLMMTNSGATNTKGGRVVGLSEHLDLQASVSSAVTSSPFVTQPQITGGIDSANELVDGLFEAIAALRDGCGGERRREGAAAEDSNTTHCEEDQEEEEEEEEEERITRLLRKVSMKLQPHLTDAGLKELVSAHPEISHLDLGHCINLTADGIIAAIETGCTQNLEVVRIGACRGSHNLVETALVRLLQSSPLLHHTNIQTVDGAGKGNRFLAAVAQKHPSIKMLNLNWKSSDGSDGGGEKAAASNHYYWMDKLASSSPSLLSSSSSSSSAAAAAAVAAVAAAAVATSSSSYRSIQADQPFFQDWPSPKTSVLLTADRHHTAPEIVLPYHQPRRFEPLGFHRHVAGTHANTGWVTDAGIKSIAARCRGLRTISLRGCTGVTDVGIAALLASCPSIRILDVSGCSITNVTLLAICRACPQITELSLADCVHVKTNGIRSIITECHSLLKLDLTGCFKISIRGLLGAKVNNAWMWVGHACTACIDRQIKANAEQHTLLHQPTPECMHMVRRFASIDTSQTVKQTRRGYTEQQSASPMPSAFSTASTVAVQLAKRIW